MNIGGAGRRRQPPLKMVVGAASAAPEDSVLLPDKIAAMLQETLPNIGQYTLRAQTIRMGRPSLHAICDPSGKPCVVFFYVGNKQLESPNCHEKLELALKSFYPEKPYLLILGDSPPHFQCLVAKFDWEERAAKRVDFIWTPAFRLGSEQRGEMEEVKNGIQTIFGMILPAIDRTSSAPRVLSVNPVSPIQRVANEPQREAGERNKPDVLDSRPQRTGVFISYSHEDEKWLKEIQTCLKPFERQVGKIFWDDTEIQTGQKWRDEIRKALVAAKVAVLLITKNFVASDFITQQELPPLLEEAQNEGLKLHCVYVGYSSFGKIFPDALQFQGANNPKEPLISLSESQLEDQLVRIAERIVEDLKQ
jgi:hypothetical protein